MLAASCYASKGQALRSEYRLKQLSRGEKLAFFAALSWDTRLPDESTDLGQLSEEIEKLKASVRAKVEVKFTSAATTRRQRQRAGLMHNWPSGKAN